VDDDDDVLFFGRVKCSVEKRHREREREERVVVCAQKRSSFPRPKNRSLLSFFLYLNGRRGKGKRDERERGILSLQTHLSVLLCAPILLLRRPEEKSGVVKEAAAIVGEEGRKRKRRRRL